MDDTSMPDTGNSAAQDDTSGSETKIYASLDSLKEGDTPPSIGDKVELTINGTVNSIEGDLACVSPDEVNGEPYQEPTDQPSSEPTPDDLRANVDTSKYQ